MKGKYWSRTVGKFRAELIQMNAGIGFGASIDIMWESVIHVEITFLFWSLALELWVRKYGEDALIVKIERDISVASADES